MSRYSRLFLILASTSLAANAHAASTRHTRATTLKSTTHSASATLVPHVHARTAARAPIDESVIVTGTHATNRHARDSASPISVISAATLRRSGQLNLADALNRTYASINIESKGSDTAALTSAIRMRGLSPNQVLVLVDGKRRHATGNVIQNSGPSFGATPVDLNMLPAGMIDHIEVLEDGAAAMYGSDAIAGVINVITKKTDHGLNLSAQTGANAYNGDGWQYLANLDGGLKVLKDGYIHISAQSYHTDHFVAKGAVDHRLLGYWPTGASTTGYYNGIVPNAKSLPLNSNQIMSTPSETRQNLGIDFGKPLNDHVDFYGQVTYAHRHAEAMQNYRTPLVAPTYYPSGFTPIETIDENDFAAELGLKGRGFFGFDWDLSTVYGADEDKVGNKNTVNPGLLSARCNNGNPANFSSIGCGYSPTNVNTLSYRNAQWTNNLDFRRAINIFDTVPMTLAMGGEHRLEMYQIVAGNPASYQVGGTQGYAGLAPQSAGKWSRNIWAAYVDGDFHPLKNWELDFAGRFEHYTDVGNTENGKVSTRVDVMHGLALRGTLSTGFRAPTLAEQHYSTMSVSPTGAAGLLPVASSAASLLGAQALKPERSVSASGGMVLEPLRGLHIEADVYQINLRDRIGQGGTVNGIAAINGIQGIRYALPPNIDPGNVSAYFFANSSATRTQGLDVKADYMIRLHQYGTLTTTLALDLNRTRLHNNGRDSRGQPFLTEQSIGYLTTAYPRSKLILNAYYTIGQWDVNLRQTRYGEVSSMLSYSDWTNGALTCPNGGGQLRYSNACFAQFKGTPRWLTDLEIGYRLNKTWHFAVGGNNLLNIRPRRIPAVNDYVGSQLYVGTASQVPITGGYYYGRINATF